MNFSAKDFNFFDKYNKSRQRAKQRAAGLTLLAMFLLFVTFCGLTIGYVMNLNMRTIQYEIESNNLFLGSASTKSKLAKNEELNTRLNEINEYNEIANAQFEKVKDGGSANSFLITSIAENITTGTSIYTMSIAGDTVEITGISDSEASIAQFEHNMLGMEYVSDVFVGSITRNETGIDCLFTMSIKLKEVATIENIGIE